MNFEKDFLRFLIQHETDILHNVSFFIGQYKAPIDEIISTLTSLEKNNYIVEPHHPFSLLSDIELTIENSVNEIVVAQNKHISFEREITSKGKLYCVQKYAPHLMKHKSQDGSLLMLNVDAALGYLKKHSEVYAPLQKYLLYDLMLSKKETDLVLGFMVSKELIQRENRVRFSGGYLYKLESKGLEAHKAGGWDKYNEEMQKYKSSKTTMNINVTGSGNVVGNSGKSMVKIGSQSFLKKRTILQTNEPNKQIAVNNKRSLWDIVKMIFDSAAFIGLIMTWIKAK